MTDEETSQLINYRLVVDLDKLKMAVDSKRRSDQISWRRLGARYGISVGAMADMNRKDVKPDRTTKKVDITGRVLVSMLDFLNRPYSDFVKKEPLEVNEIGPGE